MIENMTPHAGTPLWAVTESSAKGACVGLVIGWVPMPDLHDQWEPVVIVEGGHRATVWGRRSKVEVFIGEDNARSRANVLNTARRTQRQRAGTSS